MPPSESNRFCVSDLLVHPAILLNLVSNDRDSVLTELAGAIPELQPHPAKREILLKALRERESLHSTGIGDGIALPHARTALAGLVGRPVIVFGRHTKGIPFDAIDQKPVHLFFLLVTTSVTQHLQILARISRLLRNPVLRQQLLTAGTPGDIIDQLRTVEVTM